MTTSTYAITSPFTKETTREELTAWVNSCGMYKNEIIFILNALCTGDNKVAGKVTVANMLRNLANENKWNCIYEEAKALGYNR